MHIEMRPQNKVKGQKIRVGSVSYQAVLSHAPEMAYTKLAWPGMEGSCTNLLGTLQPIFVPPFVLIPS